MRVRATTGFLCLILTACSAMSTWPRPARAAEEGAEPPPPPLITKIYDINDLLLNLQDHPLDSSIVPATRIQEGPRSSQGDGTKYNLSRKELVDEVIKLIEDTVSSDTWKDNGGRAGIRELSGQLIISQTKEIHAEVQRLLVDLRADAHHMVTLTARWIVLGPAELRQVAKAFKPDSGASVLMEVNLAQLEKSKAGAVKYQGQITCFNRQTVHIASGQARTIVHDLTPVVGANVVAFQPEVSTVQDGASLELTPTQTPDGAKTVIDLHSVVSEWRNAPTTRPVPLLATAKSPMSAPAALDAIDRVDILVQQLRTTVAIPSGKAILIGGLTLESRSKDDADGRQMYLVIEVATAEKQ